MVLPDYWDGGAAEIYINRIIPGFNILKNEV
jgi:hypothetical protein